MIKKPIKKSVRKKDLAYLLINKSLFFPEEKILVIGDLHFGFENILREAGIPLYKKQIDEVKKEIIETYDEIKEKKFEIKKIVFLGDIKHSFSYKFLEKKYLTEFFYFISEKLKVQEKNILLIKGNHDTFNYLKNIEMKNYLVFKNILFIHGDKTFEILKNNKIKFIVMGHLHPSIILKDKQEIKKEKFKCFLIGKYKSKTLFVLPSFLNSIEGFDVSNFKNYNPVFSILNKREIENLEVFITNKKEVYNFGKIKELK